MKDIELVIKIGKEYYDEILTQGMYGSHLMPLYKALVSSTPLPKGHGRLFDEKEVDTVVNGVFNSFDKHSPETFLNVIHNQCIETIEADKEESEG